MGSNCRLLRNALLLSRLYIGDVSGGLISTERAKKLSSPLKQELSNCGVFCEADGPVVSALGCRGLPESLQEVSTNRPIGLITRDGVLIDPF